MPLTLDKGLTFLEILSRVSEELCLSNESIKVNWELNENCIGKLINEEPRITDGDFVRLIKNTIVSVRMKFEKDSELLRNRKPKKEKER
jgi:hypothetical protein